MRATRLEIRELIPATVDSKFRGARVFKKATHGWDRGRVSAKLSIDLSKCVRADLAGAAQLLTILEHACRDEIDSEVVMPAWGVLQREIDAWQRLLDDGVDIELNLRKELASRHHARITLERYGFEAALKMPHLPVEHRRVVVRDTRMDVAPLDSLSEGLRRLLSALEDLHAQVSEDLEGRLYIPTELRFRWIDRLSRGELPSIVDELERVLAQGREALPRGDARSIARTIVYEALDNVRVHAYGDHNRGAALIGAAFVVGRQGEDPLDGRQLQVVLADSGLGLVNTLRSAFDPPRHDRLLPGAVRAWSRDDKTIIWAFHPLSTSREAVVGESPVRGLSRARKQVRFHGGTIRVRTGDREVVISDAPSVARPAYDRSFRGMTPGTLLDVRLRAKDVVDETALNPAGAALRVVPLAVDVTSDRAEVLVSEAAVDVANDEVMCLIITGLDFSREGGHEAASRLARLASLVAGRATMCVLPDVPSGLIFSVLHSLTEHYEHSELLGSGGARAEALPDEAIMVLGSDRRVTWWGPLNGNEATLVELATRAGFSVEASGFDAEEVASTIDSIAADRATRAWMVNGAFAVSSPQLTSSLRQWLQDEVDDVLQSGGAGVQLGEQLLPSLEPVSRAVDVGALLQALGQTQLAGQLAGDIARRMLREQISLVVSLPDVPDHFAQAFAMSVGFDGPRLHLDPSRDGWRLGSAPEHRPGSAVLIGGTSRRGESLRNVAEALMRWGIRPQLALIIADARVAPGSTLRALDADISVLSLLRFQTPAATASFEELLASHAIAEAKRDQPYAISPERLAELLERHGDGFKLAHVERSEDRHFVGYYDFRSVLADDELRGELARTVTELVSSLSPPGLPHLVLYPADDENRAAVLARDVGDRLEDAVVQPLRRDRASTTSDEMWASGTVGTFVDWGVVTARTARVALHEMANAGAVHANFIAVASQLQHETEQHLAALASVHGRRQDAPTGELHLGAPTPAAVTVAFRPITRIASTAYTRTACPLCRAVSDFVSYARECPTEFLRTHAREKVERLRARPREEALAANADLYGADLTYAERSNLINLWSVLDRSRTSVVSRQQLRVILSDVDSGDADLTAASLCRIVSTRHDLLHSPPLSEAEYRRLIVERCRPLLTGERGYVPSPLKRQAVVTLRAASKEHFVQEIPAILDANLRSRTVVAEVLLAVYSIIRRPYYQGSGLMDLLIKSLNACDDLASTAYRSGRTDPDVVQTIRSLRRTATTIRVRQGAGGRQLALAALRGAYREEIREHHHAINRMAQVSRQLNDLATIQALATGDPDRLISELERMEAAWNICADFLASGVLPYLRDLREVLSAKYYQEQVGDPAVWEPWITLLSSDITENDIPFGRLLSRLLLDPAEFTNARPRLLLEIDWLQAVFLGIRRTRSGSLAGERRQTLLLRWLGECPTPASRMREYLELELSQAGQSTEPIALVGDTVQVVDGIEVFLPAGLMREIAATLANNVQEHGDLPRTRTTLEVSVTDDAVDAIFTSVGSGRGVSRRPGRRGGLAGLESRIAPFGAQVDGRVAGRDFVTTISTRRWVGYEQ